MQSFFWVAVVSGNSTTVAFLEDLLTLSNVYERFKIFEIIESRKFGSNVDYPFGLKRLFFCINIPDTFLA